MLPCCFELAGDNRGVAAEQTHSATQRGTGRSTGVHKALAKDLRNAERKKRRLRDRARQLTDDDLVSVLMMRKDLKKNDNAADGNAAVAPGDDDHAGDGEALDE